MMIPFKNTVYRFGILTIFLHWIIAIIIIALLILGLYMVRQPVGIWKLHLYGWHKEYGLLILALVIVRVLWRIINIDPQFPAHMPQWEKVAARFVHWTFYLFMFLMPLTGWLMSSAVGLPASFFGLFTLPDLISPGDNKFQFFKVTHEWLGYGLIAIIILHISAAFKHLLINKDDIMRRILWP